MATASACTQCRLAPAVRAHGGRSGSGGGVHGVTFDECRWICSRIPVTSHEVALPWYERLLGGPPSFVASDTEAGWELAEHRSVFIEQCPEHAGHATHTILVDDLDAVVEQVAQCGLHPVTEETCPNGVRKATFRDPDGHEIGYGGGPASD